MATIGWWIGQGIGRYSAYGVQGEARGVRVYSSYSLSRVGGGLDRARGKLFSGVENLDHLVPDANGLGGPLAAELKIKICGLVRLTILGMGCHHVDDKPRRANFGRQLDHLLPVRGTEKMLRPGMTLMPNRCKGVRYEGTLSSLPSLTLSPTLPAL